MEALLEALLNATFVIIFMLMVILEQEIMVILLENIEALDKEIVILTLNQIIKLLLYSTT